MFVSLLLVAINVLKSSASIIENGRIRSVTYDETKLTTAPIPSEGWKAYPANASEISYKGRWDKNFISWWSAPGLNFGYTGGKVALTFGEHTSPGVLVGYRFDGLDWQFTNVTQNSTHQFSSAQVQNQGTQSLKVDTTATARRTFELRVTNWGYGVQIKTVHTASNGALFRIPSQAQHVEIIGDSLTAGQYASYEALSSWAWSLGNGLGAEFSISAYPGICLSDIACWGNTHGQSYQWFRTSDSSWRGQQVHRNQSEQWDFASRPPADLVILHLGTNDHSNNVTGPAFVTNYIDFIGKIHKIWPGSTVIIMTLCNGFWLDQRNVWQQTCEYEKEVAQIGSAYKSEGWLHIFDTKGVLAHNDIGPQWHYTDVGNVKLASHLLQYVRLKLNWTAKATGAEVLHDTTYWNDQSSY